MHRNHKTKTSKQQHSILLIISKVL